MTVPAAHEDEVFDNGVLPGIHHVSFQSVFDWLALCAQVLASLVGSETPIPISPWSPAVAWSKKSPNVISVSRRLPAHSGRTAAYAS